MVPAPVRNLGAMRHHGGVHQSSRPVTDPLSIAALDTERHVASGGWDQNPRLFALVPTAELVQREPHLRAQLQGHDLVAGALSAVEQENLPPTANLESLLGGIAWPDTVVGAALAVERIVVPPEAERDLPAASRRRRRRAGRPPLTSGRPAARRRHPRRPEPCACCDSARTTATTRSRSDEDIAPGLVHALKATLQG